MTELKNKLQTTLAYPFMVCLMGTIVVWFMLARVVPVFGEVFTEFGAELPAPTKFWLGMADTITYRWPPILIGFAALVISFKLAQYFLAQTEGGRCWMDSVHLHIPILGRLYYLVVLTRFCRTLSLLLSSRVPILDSLELSAAASGSAMLQRVADEASLLVAGGERIADSLSSTGFFAHNFCWLLATGEERGEAEFALDSLADTFERESASRDRYLTTLASPIIILVVGVVVASIIFSLYLPLFSLGDAIM